MLYIKKKTRGSSPPHQLIPGPNGSGGQRAARGGPRWPKEGGGALMLTLTGPWPTSGWAKLTWGHAQVWGGLPKPATTQLILVRRLQPYTPLPPPGAPADPTPVRTKEKRRRGTTLSWDVRHIEASYREGPA